MRIGETEALLQEGWGAKVWEESQEQDIFTGLAGTYDEKSKQLPDGILNRVKLEPGENSKTIPMILDLEGAGLQGAGKTVNLSTDVETQRMLHQKVYANDVRHFVNEERFGLYAHRNAPYKLMDRVNAQFAKWLKARRGKHMRQGLLEGASDNLEEAPTSLSVGWAHNFLVKNVADDDQPVYDSNLSDFSDSIMSALDAAGTTANALLNADFFTHLRHFIGSVWKIVPMDNGKYIVTIPARQARFLKLNSSDESLSWIQRTSFVKELSEKGIQQVLGEFADMILCVDERAPILDYNTNADSLSAFYRDVGSVDYRTGHVNDADHKVYDIGFVVGKGGLTETTAMPTRYDSDLFNVGQREVIGLSSTYGYQGTQFDADTPTDTSKRAQNYAVFAAYSGAAST